MTGTKSLKRALFSSAISLFLCFAMLLGTTFAWFTDSAASNGNKIIAGNLDVELWHHTAPDTKANISDTKPPVLDANIKWEPGYTEVVYLSIKNNGTLALKYTVVIDVAEPVATQDSLTQALLYSITPNAKITDTTKPAWDNANGLAVTLGKNIAKFDANTNVVDMTLEPGEEHFFALSVHMLETVGNEFMGEQISFDINVYAGQLSAEADSFGPGYDADATYPATGTVTVANGTAATIDTGDMAKIDLPAGVPAGVYAFTMANKATETDASGATTLSMDLDLTRDGVKVSDDGTEYTVSLNVGTGLRILSVYHDGYALYNFEYDYDAATGILTFTTTSFSPFAVKYDEVRTVTGLSGSGTEADPYLINDYYDLCWFRDHVNTCAQDGSSQYAGKYIKLTADIDLAGIAWEPIGSSIKDHGSFYGTFDGDGHTIKNLYVDLESGQGAAGFFAKVSGSGDGPRAVVKNLVFENVDVYSPDSYVGGVIGNAGGNSEIRNVTVKGEIYIVGYGYVGGIIGHGYPDMYDCHVEGDGEYSYILCNYWCGGGLIGYAGEGNGTTYGTMLEGCSVSDIYIWSDYGGAGALAGLLNANNFVKDCYAENVEISLNSTYASGLACGNGEESTYDNVMVKNVVASDGYGDFGPGHADYCDNDALIIIP